MSRESLQVHILGALRKPDAPKIEDPDALAEYLSTYLTLQAEGLGWLSQEAQGFWVNVYEVIRKRGGPEEGGWYYNAGSPICCNFCETREEAEQVEKDCKEVFAGQAWGNIYSVQGGVEIRVMIEDTRGEPFPSKTPHYE